MFVNEVILQATTGILVLTSTNAVYQFLITIDTNAEVTARVKILRAVIVVNVTLVTKIMEKVVCYASTSTNVVLTVSLYAKETVKTSQVATSALAQEVGVYPEARIARTWTNAKINQVFAELDYVKTRSAVTTVCARVAF